MNRNAPFSMLPARKFPDVPCASHPSKNGIPDDGKSRRIIFSDQRSLQKVSTEYYSTKTFSAIATGSTFDLLEALSFEPMSTEASGWNKAHNKEQEDFSGFSPNVEKLIRETDEAFRAVGEALAGSILQGQRWHESEPRLLEQGHYIEPPRIPSKNPRRTPVPEQAMAIPVTEMKLRSKKTIKKKKKPSLRPVHTVMPSSANTPGRWTLNMDNLVDVLSGKKFRIEADEMLTPDRLEEIKRNMKLERDKRASVESARSARSTDTGGSSPTEPFHLQSLFERISAAQNNESVPPIPARIPPAVPTASTSLVSPLSPQNIEESTKESNTKDPKSPSTLTRPTRSASSRTTSLQLLPTISEISPITISAKHVSGSSTLSSSRTSQTYLLLPSTRYTLLAPRYCQGPIRVENPIPECRSPEEEQLDWTAFQMALSGMNDTLVGEDEWEQNDAELDEIAIWWTSYGFGLGYMETADSMIPVKIKMPPIQQIQRQTPVHRSIHGRAGSQTFGLGNSWRRHAREELDTGKIVSKLESLNRSRRFSFTESLPPSPMLEIKVPLNSRNQDIIPMGFNLQHDIGDFLSWETSHVQQTIV